MQLKAYYSKKGANTLNNNIAFSPKYKKIIFNTYNNGSDKGKIRIIDANDGMKIDDISMHSIEAGVYSVNDDYFLTMNNYGNDIQNASLDLRHFANPTDKICNWSINDSEVTLTIEQQAPNINFDVFWSQYPDIKYNNAHLFHFNPKFEKVKKYKLDWLNEDNFDLGYQGVTKIVKLPWANKATVFVAKSNTAFETDLDNGNYKRIKIGTEYNQLNDFIFLYNHILAIGYDSLYLIKKDNYQVLKEAKIQPCGTQTINGIEVPISQFIGDVCVDQISGLIYVCRPFSNDVAVVSIADFKVIKKYNSRFQPFYVFKIDNKIVNIDWISQDAEIISLAPI